jgi:hypothetical protein
MYTPQRREHSWDGYVRYIKVIIWFWSFDLITFARHWPNWRVVQNFNLPSQQTTGPNYRISPGWRVGFYWYLPILLALVKSARDPWLMWLVCDVVGMYVMWLVCDGVGMRCGWYVMWLVYDVVGMRCGWYVMWLVCDVVGMWCGWHVLICDVAGIWCDVVGMWCGWYVMWLVCMWCGWYVMGLVCDVAGMWCWYVMWLLCYVAMGCGCYMMWLVCDVMWLVCCSQRILPHHQDTGGFFVAVLTKKANLPWSKEAKGQLTFHHHTFHVFS